MTTTPEETRPRLRPLSLGEILDVSIKICLAHWRTLLVAVLVVVVPLQILDTVVNADYTADSFDFTSSSSGTADESLDELNGALGGLAISSLLQGIAVLFAMATCFRAIAQAYLGHPTDWRSSLAYAVRHAGPLVWLTLLYGVGLLFATLLFVLPGIWLYIGWAFAMPVLLIEGRRGTKALRRSLQLVRGRWWSTFGVVVVGFILAAIVSFLVQAVFLAGLVFGSDNNLLVLVLSTIAGIVGLAIGTPFQAALLTVLYFDLRVRKEGFDLELLAEEIGSEVPAGSAGFAPIATAVEPSGGAAPPYWPPPQGWKPPEPDDEAAAQPGPAPKAPPYRPPPPGWRRPAREPEDVCRRDDDEPPRLPGVPYG
ncbi:MAG TPA: glycerophosphoryl diester phosphodiesterase membrane domain-containing protein [Solirubrobacteraceae bacterium]|nr:glycerophosphoryl diester phosphodiesterase membrane domain-containing protein [Solirubrobacteraceae bacterium]